MSHVAVIVTSERCGHCRTMRGDGRLLSKLQTKDKKPNIPGGYFYDAAFMKKIITADMNTGAKVRVINVHYKTFNPADGIMDISVMMLDTDGNSVKQTMLKEKNGKTSMSIYSIGETGKVISSQDTPEDWSNIVKSYIPVNITNYSVFFPSIILFEGTAWAEGIKNATPIYGYLNGFETKKEAPYGVAISGNVQPNVMEFPKFVNQFFNGAKELRGAPIVNSAPVAQAPVTQEPPPYVPKEVKKDTVAIPTLAARDKLKVRLFVVEK